MFTALMWPRLTVTVLVALRRSALTVVHHLCVDDVIRPPVGCCLSGTSAGSDRTGPRNGVAERSTRLFKVVVRPADPLHVRPVEGVAGVRDCLLDGPSIVLEYRFALLSKGPLDGGTSESVWF